MQPLLRAENRTSRRGGLPAAFAGTILVVDGHPLLRHGFTRALWGRQPDAAVMEAGSVDEALARIAATPDLAVVLADLDLVSGAADGLGRLLAALGPVPLLVLAGSADSAAIRTAVRAGVRGCVLKSGTPAVLEHAIRLALSDDTFLPLPRAALAGGMAAGPAAAPGVDDLTGRQREVFDLLLAGRSNKEIARTLGVLEGTVKVHVRAVMQKLGVRNRTQAAVLAALVLSRGE